MMSRSFIFSMLILTGSLLFGQTGSLLYDIGIVVEDSTGLELDVMQDSSLPEEITEEQKALEEELNRYQQKLVDTEIRLLKQTRIIDSLQTEIAMIKAAGETDKALLTSKISDLEDQQSKGQVTPEYPIDPTSMSDSVFAELNSPWKNVPITHAPQRNMVSGPPLTIHEEQAAYRRGLTKFHQEYFYQAIDEFNTIVHRGQDADMRANSEYWVGRCYYEKGLFDEAISSFERLQQYPHSDKQDDALVMIGLAFKNKNRMSEAKLAFQELVAKHPGSEYLTLAKRFVKD